MLYTVILARPPIGGEMDTYMTCVRAKTPAEAIDEAKNELYADDGDETMPYPCIACIRGDQTDLTPPEYR